jgi:hypothetical protein
MAQSTINTIRALRAIREMPIPTLANEVAELRVLIQRASTPAQRHQLEQEIVAYETELERKQEMVAALDDELADVRTLILNLKREGEDVAYLEKRDAQILDAMKKIGAPLPSDDEDEDYYQEDSEDDYCYTKDSNGASLCNQCGKKTCLPSCCQGCGVCDTCRF